MSDIKIRRQHGKSLTEARAAAEHMASELREEFALDYTWSGDHLHFKRPGVSGDLLLDEQEVALTIHLGFLLFALKPSIERAIHRYFEENFPA